MSIREEFEAWYLENWGCTEDNLDSLFEESPHGGEYYRFGVRLAWQAWQEATKQVEAKCAALAAENASLKSNLMFWDADDPEIPYEHPDEIASEYDLDADTVFDVQVAARLPDRKYRVVTMTDDECRTEQVSNGHIQTPATDAFLREVRAQGAEACVKALATSGDDDFTDAPNICACVAYQLRKGGAA